MSETAFTAITGAKRLKTKQRQYFLFRLLRHKLKAFSTEYKGRDEGEFESKIEGHSNETTVRQVKNITELRVALFWLNARGNTPFTVACSEETRILFSPDNQLQSFQAIVRN